MNIYQYIKENGNYSFEEKKINEVDFIIFSFLSYADLTKVFEGNNIYTLQEVGKIHKEKLPGKDTNVMAVKEGNKILRAMMNTKRYKDCLIYNHTYISNEIIQFGAISIEYQKNKVYISYEGTDQSFSGWKENFILSYNSLTESHKYAIKYLNKYFTWNTKELNKEIIKWVKQCNKEDKEEFVNNFDSILRKANVTTILDLKAKKRKLIELLYDSKDISETSKRIIIELINILIKCFKDTKKEELKNAINNFYTIINKGIK